VLINLYTSSDIIAVVIRQKGYVETNMSYT